MSDSPQPPGWYYAQGDPPDTQRYWDGSQWQGGPQPVPAAGQAGPGMVGGGGGTAAMGLADSGKRVVARLIDFVIWVIIWMIIAAVVGGGSANIGTGFSGRGFIAGIVATLAVIGLEFFLTSSKGQSVGKMAMSLKVVKEDGSALDTQAAGMRVAPLVLGIFPFISLIMWLIGLVSLVFLFTDERRQAIWDKLAKTIVVDA